MDIAGIAFLSVIGLLALGVWIFALYHAACTDLFGPRERGIWLVFIAAGNFLGAIVFLLAPKSLREQSERKAAENENAYPNRSSSG